MTTLSLLRCVGCQQTTGDATSSRRDGEPRCGPCERRADHERRLEAGDRWYGERIIEYAERAYGPDWEQLRGWEFCAALFADSRALGGWRAVGVEMPAPHSRFVVDERRCPRCGETTTSVSNYFCAGCHFRGWYGRWASDDKASEQPADERSTT